MCAELRETYLEGQAELCWGDWGRNSGNLKMVGKEKGITNHVYKILIIVSQGPRITRDDDLKASWQPEQALGPVWESECRAGGVWRSDFISGRPGDLLGEDVWGWRTKDEMLQYGVLQQTWDQCPFTPILPLLLTWCINLGLLFNLSVLVWKMKLATGSTGYCMN